MAMRSANGTVEGTGASINISVGFAPTKVRCVNIDGDAIMEWTEDYADGTGYKTLGAGTGALMATLGITPYAGASGSAGVGFTIGADTDVNASAETINWSCEGDDI